VVALYDGAGAVCLAALDDVGHLGVDLQDPLLAVLVLHAPHPHVLQRYDALHPQKLYSLEPRNGKKFCPAGWGEKDKSQCWKYRPDLA